MYFLNRKKVKNLYNVKLIIGCILAVILLVAIWYLYFTDAGKIKRMVWYINKGDNALAVHIYDTLGMDDIDNDNMNLEQKQMKALFCYAAYMKAYQDALDVNTIRNELSVIKEKKELLEDYEGFLCLEARNNIMILEREINRSDFFDKIDSYFQETFRISKLAQKALCVFTEKQEAIYQKLEFFSIAELRQLQNEYTMPALEGISSIRKVSDEFQAKYEMSIEHFVSSHLHSHEDDGQQFRDAITNPIWWLGWTEIKAALSEEESWIDKYEEELKNDFDDYTEESRYQRKRVSIGEDANIWYRELAEKYLEYINGAESLYTNIRETEIKELCSKYQWQENKEAIEKLISSGLQPVSQIKKTEKAENNNISEPLTEEIIYKIRHVNSGVIDGSDTFDSNSEFNNGHSILTISYQSFVDLAGNEIKLTRSVLSTDLFYFDEGYINERAFIDGSGLIGNWKYNKEYVKIIDEFDEQSVMGNGYRKTMKIFIVYDKEGDIYRMSSIVTVSRTGEDVREFLNTSIKWLEEYPSNIEKDEYRKICKAIFDSIEVTSSYRGPGGIEEAEDSTLSRPLIGQGDTVRGFVERRYRVEDENIGGYDYNYYVLAFENPIDLELINENGETYIAENYREIAIYVSVNGVNGSFDLGPYVGKEVNCKMYAFDTYTSSGINAEVTSLEILSDDKKM